MRWSSGSPTRTSTPTRPSPQHHGLTVPLLADVDQRGRARVRRRRRRVIGTRRAAFVIDEDGIVRHRHVHALGLDFQDADDLAAALDALPARA